MMKRVYAILIVCCLSSLLVHAGTTGKIAGTITDAETGGALPGANVLIVGTSMGAAANIEGYYVILNVPPGDYSLRVSMIGYANEVVRDVRVSIDLTTTIDLKLRAETLAAEEVVVVAERPVVQPDISGSQVHVSARDVEIFPVRSGVVTERIASEPGILTSTQNDLLVRGGGADETAFMIDGFALRDERNNQAYTNIALSAIQDVQVQTGGFNAEYGNLRSGVVNVVTREGDRRRYSGSITARYSPAARKNFGPSGFDPMGYWARPYLDPAVAWTGTDNGAWDAFTQRQYPQFLGGWNAVSERLLNDNDPTNDLTPAAAQRLWQWQHRKQGDIQEPDYNVDLGFGGPVPFLSQESLGSWRFFFSFRRREDMYLVPLSRDGLTDNFYQLKLNGNISPSMKVTISGLYTDLYAVGNNQIGLPTIYRSPETVATEMSQRSFIDAVMYNSDYYAPSDVYRNLISVKLTHTLSSNTFYEAKLERGGTNYRTFPRELRDTSRVQEFAPGYFTDEAPFGFWPYPSSGIDGMRMGVGMSNSRDSTKIYQWIGSFDLTSQLDRYNQVKTGVELVVTNHDAKFGGVDLTLPAGRPSASWDRTPVRGALYVQDKLEFKGLIANLGMRLEYASAGGKWWEVDPFDVNFFGPEYRPEKDSTFAQKDVEKQWFLSPRLGISHPITENSKLFFNYGHARSWPEAQALYMIQRTTNFSTQLYADPNLRLSKTVQYEVGYEQNMFGRFLLRIAGYYKDVTENLPDSRADWILYQSDTKGINYRRASDNFFEDIRGFEVSVNGRTLEWMSSNGKRGSWLNGFVNFTYQATKSGYFGKLSYSDNPAEQREFDRENNRPDKPVPRPFFRANVNSTSPSDFGPALLGHHLFGDLSLGFVVDWRYGLFGTWTRGLDADKVGIQNNVQWPDYFNVNLRLGKDVALAGLSMRVFLDVSNVFNNKIFTSYAFSDGNDFRDYMNSLLWPEHVGQPLGYSHFGNDQIGDLRPAGVAYDPLEDNPNNDPQIEARNQQRRASKSYIDNPNLEWLYYLNPRDIFFGVKIDF